MCVKRLFLDTYLPDETFYTMSKKKTKQMTYKKTKHKTHRSKTQLKFVNKKNKYFFFIILIICLKRV